MNKQIFARIAGTAALALLLQPGVFAQSNDNQKPENPDKLGEYDEIIIKRKDDKDAKVTIEIRDNQVFVDGKPVSQYENDTLSVRKKRIRMNQVTDLSFVGPGPDGATNLRIAPSPFRGHGGVWNYGGEEAPGKTRPALLGVYPGKNEAEGGGAIIKGLTPGSAAEKAGLQKGDVITGVDGIKIDSPENLYDAIHKYKPQDPVTITYQRDGKEQKTKVVLGEGRPGPGQPYLFNLPDIGNIDITPYVPRTPNYPGAPNFPGAPGYPGGPNFPGGPLDELRVEGRPRLGIHAQDTEDGKGVKVLEVDGGSSAEKAGIKEGDIITRFDGKEINSAGSLAEIARAGRDKTSVKVNLIRNGSPRELEIKVPRKLKTVDL